MLCMLIIAAHNEVLIYRGPNVVCIVGRPNQTYCMADTIARVL